MKPLSKNGILIPQLSRHLDAGRLRPLDDHNEYSQVQLTDDDLTGESASYLVFEQVILKVIIFNQSKLASLRVLDSRIEKCDFSAADWEKAHFRRVEFAGCRMLATSLLDASFDDVFFYDCNVEGAKFISARFKAARFEKCNLKEASFENADLSGVVFHECDLSHADLRGAKLARTDFRTSTINGLQAGIIELQGAIIAPAQAVQVVNLLGIKVKEDDEPDLL